MWKFVILLIFLIILIKLICNNINYQKSYSDDFTDAEKKKIRECLYRELHRQQLCQNKGDIKELERLVIKWEIVSEIDKVKS